MCLDVMQLPKPFRINTVNTRGWGLGSEWRRFNPLILDEPPPAPPSMSAALPSSAPTSTLPASDLSGLSPNPG